MCLLKNIANEFQAGLAAYFFGLSSLSGNWHQGTVSTDIKNYIAEYAYVRNQNPLPPASSLPFQYTLPAADTMKVAYNRAPDE